MNELFENAIDSIDFGLRLFLHGEFETSHKHALLSVFHGVELLLKARLYQEHPLLIFKKPDAKLSDDSYTIGLRETLARFGNCGIEIAAADVSVLDDLRRRRNRIAHHRYVKDNQDYRVLGKALKFVYHFLPQHLDTTLEEHLDEELFEEAKQAILSYEELLAEAEQEVARRTTPRTKDDLADPVPTATCPKCDNETLVLGTELGDHCFFCREHFVMEQCPSCAQYVPPEYFDDLAICRDCFNERIGRDDA